MCSEREARENRALLNVATAVADGQLVDWVAADAAAETAEERELLRLLNAVARVAEHHRQDQADNDE
jgi:hypothetical protein